MIELRWLEKPLIIRVNGEHEDLRRIKVLQYRKWKEFTSEGNSFMPVSWSEWQDVPTVREE